MNHPKPECIFKAGLRLYEGVLCTRNERAGRKQIELSANMGHRPAMKWLAVNARCRDVKVTWYKRMFRSFVCSRFKERGCLYVEKGYGFVK